MKQSSPVTIREMRAVDVEAVRNIAEKSQLASWSKNSYEQELLNVNSRALVAVGNSEIIGFIVARLAENQLEILNIAVSNEQRRKKIGEDLLQQILQLAASAGAEYCWLEVREQNVGALNFYLAHNFEKTGKRRFYYANPTDHAILMTLNLCKK